MRSLDAQAYEEVLNLAAESELDPELRLIRAAQLREFKRLDSLFRRGTRSLRDVSLEFAKMPALDDLQAWRRLVAAGAEAREAAEPGAPDLLRGAQS